MNPSTKNRLMKPSHLSFYLLGLFFFIEVCKVGAQINYDHFIRSGQGELQKENYLGAIKDFNTAIFSHHKGFEAFFLRGIAKFSLGDYSGATDDFTTTVDIHPLYARAYLYRGISFDQLGDYPHAIRDFNKALEIDPFNADFFLARGDTKMHLHNFT
ncbi:MAG: hypothetical protein CVT99_10665 [Bacteroidetes bacterium HGW-Bacteroidetes-16]|jgi:tetratricopeptide (TPR) repeat protein|nr:MAG: hypothetical protein CVT99_10665 [Bacteroidetes bacterium HGW-Bacteroidetes-16]